MNRYRGFLLGCSCSAVRTPEERGGLEIKLRGRCVAVVVFEVLVAIKLLFHRIKVNFNIEGCVSY